MWAFKERLGRHRGSVKVRNAVIGVQGRTQGKKEGKGIGMNERRERLRKIGMDERRERLRTIGMDERREKLKKFGMKS